MGKRISLAILWGLAIWVWVSMAHAFLGIPELGPLAGPIVAAAILIRGSGWARVGSRAARAGSGYVHESS